MIALTIRPDASSPAPTVQRQAGRLNLGLYCNKEACREFIAFAIIDDSVDPRLTIEIDPPEGRMLILCPSCSFKQLRSPNALEILFISAQTQQLSIEQFYRYRCD